MLEYICQHFVSPWNHRIVFHQVDYTDRTGIGPEVFYFLANDQWNGNGVPSKDELTFYNEHGFWITGKNPKFIHPES